MAGVIELLEDFPHAKSALRDQRQACTTSSPSSVQRLSGKERKRRGINLKIGGRGREMDQGCSKVK